MPAFESGDTDYEESRTRAARAAAEQASASAYDANVIACTIVASAYERYREEFPDRGVVMFNINFLGLTGSAAPAVN
ncbi:hypothetical protein [Streptomyces sp. MBT53]|uniref:hypothetical protein n=1 Tax=Streptomyces sp. MBT53 TaxID=1488384 RepID=UPI0019132AC9|nr:hypothetical protein [Streptomyces sp. MBT53]MBK6011692.1 hypothetical protein [Streptomyces sp. MBT53]